MLMTVYGPRLKRLEPEHYRGLAWVHWTLTIDDRRTGWLDGKFLYRFRELLTHNAFRYQVACPIYCLLPDHVHLLWCGLVEASDQRLAMQSFRQDSNDSLRRIGFEFQRQAYDNVLEENELERDAIEALVEYIARNPERKKLVPTDAFASYPYTGCLIPGYPRIRLFQVDGWEPIWRTLSFLKRTQCHRIPDPKRQA